MSVTGKRPPATSTVLQALSQHIRGAFDTKYRGVPLADLVEATIEHRGELQGFDRILVTDLRGLAHQASEYADRLESRS